MARHLGTSLGGLILPGHPGHPHTASVTPAHAACLSLSAAVTHADEMLFNTQSTVLTSPWGAGHPLEGRRGIDFQGGDGGPRSFGDMTPSPAAIIVRLAGVITAPRPDGRDMAMIHSYD